MKRSIATLIVALPLICMSSLATADPMNGNGGPGGGGNQNVPAQGGGPGGHGGGHQGGSGGGGGPGGGGPQGGGPHAFGGWHGGDGGPVGHGYAQGPGPDFGMHPGNRLPPRYFHGPGFWINDWQAYNLPSPPMGQQWVDVNGTFFLTAVATGIIADIITHPHP